MLMVEEIADLLAFESVFINFAHYLGFILLLALIDFLIGELRLLCRVFLELIPTWALIIESSKFPLS